MTIEAIRFRVQDGLCVLQVSERDTRYQHGYEQQAKWRDAQPEDLLLVASYTRAHDAMDSLISSCMSSVESLQQTVISLQAHVMQEAERKGRA